MLDRVLAVQDYTACLGAQAFRSDRKTQDAVLRRFEVLGEAAGRLIRAGAAPSMPELALREIYDMRNALIHGYDGVDIDVVWKTVIGDLPPLRDALTSALADG